MFVVALDHEVAQAPGVSCKTHDRSPRAAATVVASPSPFFGGRPRVMMRPRNPPIAVRVIFGNGEPFFQSCDEFPDHGNT